LGMGRGRGGGQAVPAVEEWDAAEPD